jgi:hypothetical protein
MNKIINQIKFIHLEAILLVVLNMLLATVAQAGRTVEPPPANPPSVSFTVSSQTVNETDGLVYVTIELSSAAVVRTVVPYTLEGTATSGTDYRGVTSAFVFRTGRSSITKKFTIISDGIAEDAETIILKLAATDYAKLGTNPQQTITIKDNPQVAPPVAQWSIGFQTINEKIGMAMITANLDKTSTVPVLIPYSVAGTATRGSDHNLSNGTITISAGSLSQNTVFQILDDLVYDDGETINVSMSTPANANLGPNSVHIVTITDDELAPVINFELANQTALENIGTATAKVILDKASSKEVRATLALSGTATTPADYNLSSSTVIIPAGATSTFIQLPIISDTLYEASETVVLRLQSPTGGSLGPNIQHTVTITNDDAAPSVQFQSLSQKVIENQGAVSAVIALNKVSGLETIIPFTLSGTAQNPSDHNLAPASVKIPAGQLQVAISFQVVNDGMTEADETLILTLGTPTNAILSGTNSSHTVTISDVPPDPKVEWSVATQNLDENVSPGIATARLSAASTKTVTVIYAVSGNANNSTLGRTKFNLSSGTLTFAPGTLTQDLQIPLINDNLAGPSDLNIILTLVSPVNATLGTIVIDTLTIIDSDKSTLAGEEAFRTTVWPLTRQRCMACHNSSTSIPNHASDLLNTAYTAAKPLALFSDIPNSRLVTKSADSHCGVFCAVTGSANDTKPLMITAITNWGKFEPSASLTPTPTSTPIPTGTATPVPGSVAMLDGTQFLEYITGSVGLSSGTYKTVTPFTDLIYRMSANEDPNMVDAPMLLAYLAMAGRVCNDLVTKEAGFPINSTSRLVFGPIDFVTSTNVLTVVLSRANLDAVTNNLSKRYLLRDASLEEKDAIASMVATATLARTLTSNDTRQLMVMACTSIAVTAEGLQH